MGYYLKPKPKIDKKLTERWHGQVRLAERFGFTADDLPKIRKQIRNGESELVKRQSNRVTHHRVFLHGVKMIAVWDKKRREIITFLKEGENHG